MNKKKKFEIPYSKKLKKITMCIFFCMILFSICFVLNIIFTIYNIPRFPINILVFVFLVFGIILFYFYDKELKIITNMSIIYYKQQTSTIYSEFFVYMICLLFSFAASFINSDSYITIELLTTIHISIFSLIFVLYLFILPTYNKLLKDNIKKLQKYKKSKLPKTIPFHGKIYYNSKIFNSLTISMISSVILFCISIFVMFMFNIIYLSYLIMFFSIFYYLYFIIRLTEVIWKLYKMNINDIENLLDEKIC